MTVNNTSGVETAPRASRSRKPIASVVIPAHNEGKVIGRCLRSMLQDMNPGELEIVVVCNGCSDQTSSIARSFGPTVRVCEIDQRNKSLALNQGDALARSFPRIYIDADIEITTESIRKTVAGLETGGFMAGSPSMTIELDHLPWSVRAFYRVWRELPYYQSTPVGCGVYALSEPGRKSFASFPDVMAEDDYVRLSFKESQRVIVRDATFKIRPPSTLKMLIRIRARQQRAYIFFKRSHPHLRSTPRRRYLRSMTRILTQPSLWPCLVLYSYVHTVTRVMAWHQARGPNPRHEWDRDHEARSM